MTVLWGGGSSWSSQHDGRRSGYQGPRVPPNLLRKSVPPTSASRRLRYRFGGPDSRSATRRRGRVLDEEGSKRRQVMTHYQPISVAVDRVVSALAAGLEIEFGRGAAEALAQRFLEAEDVDFHWDARLEERWIGSYEGSNEDDLELDRVRILGRLDGDWFVAVMIVDGDGNAHAMMGRRRFRRRFEAARAFADA